MNKRSTQPRKSSTNNRALSTRLNNLSNDTRTYPTFSELRGNPPPTSNNFKVVKRTVQVMQTTAATGLTVGNLSSALEGVGGDFLVSRIDAYCIEPGSSQTPSALFTLKTGNILPEEVNNTLVDLKVTDYGTATSLPGTRFSLPKTRSKWFNKDTAGTTALCLCSKSAVFVVKVMQQFTA
jgi:hypothetical protein